MKNVSTNHKSNHDKSHIEFEQKIKPPTTTKKILIERKYH